MAAPLILARTFKDAHAFAQGELGLSIGYYRVVNSAGTIKACRNVDIFLVPGWDKRPDRFTMGSALKWCRLNIRDVAVERESADAFDAAMPPTPADTSVHWVTPLLAMAHALPDITAVQSSKNPADVTCEACLSAIAAEQEIAESLDEPVAEVPEPAEAEDVTEEPAPDPLQIDDEIVIAADNRTNIPTVVSPEAEALDKAAPKRRRRKCKKCEQLHYTGDPCIESEDS